MMETRQITQCHIYYLVLNGVYDRCEDRNIVAVAEDPGTLISLYNNDILPYEERFRDEYGRYRSFKQGLLYGYNTLPFELNSPYSYDGLGIKDSWVNQDEVYDIRNRFAWVGEQSYV